MTDLVQRLRDTAGAYPEDVFGSVTPEEVQRHASLITRNSAAMGRHLGAIMLEAAEEIERLRDASPYAVRSRAVLLSLEEGYRERCNYCHGRISICEDAPGPNCRAKVARITLAKNVLGPGLEPAGSSAAESSSAAARMEVANPHEDAPLTVASPAEASRNMARALAKIRIIADFDSSDLSDELMGRLETIWVIANGEVAPDAPRTVQEQEGK